MTPESDAFTFVVLHRAAPQGSKVMDTGKNGKTFMRESSKGVRPFRTALRRAAMGSDGRPRASFGERPVVVQIEFEFVRPRTNDDPHPTTKGTVGDVDKLSRAVLDGLTEAEVIADDRFVVKLEAAKAWGDENRAIITVSPIETHLVFSDGSTQRVGPTGAEEFAAAMEDARLSGFARNPFEHPSGRQDHLLQCWDATCPGCYKAATVTPYPTCCNSRDHKSCNMLDVDLCPCPTHCTA